MLAPIALVLLAVNSLVRAAPDSSACVIPFACIEGQGCFGQVSDSFIDVPASSDLECRNVCRNADNGCTAYVFYGFSCNTCCRILASGAFTAVVQPTEGSGSGTLGILGGPTICSSTRLPDSYTNGASTRPRSFFAGAPAGTPGMRRRREEQRRARMQKKAMRGANPIFAAAAVERRAQPGEVWFFNVTTSA